MFYSFSFRERYVNGWKDALLERREETPDTTRVVPGFQLRIWSEKWLSWGRRAKTAQEAECRENFRRMCYYIRILWEAIWCSMKNVRMELRRPSVVNWREIQMWGVIIVREVNNTKKIKKYKRKSTYVIKSIVSYKGKKALVMYNSLKCL